jgi:hypothetical protein
MFRSDSKVMYHLSNHLSEAPTDIRLTKVKKNPTTRKVQWLELDIDGKTQMTISYSDQTKPKLM